jgi:hypothetical protein
MMKNIRDLGIQVKHAEFLCQQGQPNLFPSMPKHLKSMYDLMQAIHQKSLSCSVIAKGRQSAEEKFKRLTETIDASGEKEGHCIARSRQCTMM